MTITHGVPERPAAAWRDLAGTDLWLHCLTIAAPRRTVSGETLPPPADEVEALAGLLAYLAADDGPPHYNSRTAICLAAELAARRNDEATAIALVRWWALHTQPKWAAFDIDLLARNRALAPLLLRGVLAEALRLDAAACAGYLGILLPAIAERRRHGRVLSHGRWSWKRLLKEISVRAIDREPDHVTPQQRRRRWLGRPRASAEVIAATETRLGVTLPPDYRAFLETSDGFEPWKATAPQLLPAAEIDYLSRVSDPALMDIYRDYGDDVARAIEGAIRISTDKEQMFLLLPPATNPEGDGWGAWFFAPWVPGEWRHQSFRHYMEDELRGMEAGE